jgi:rsbT co-antagonist protein RsbR
MSSGPASIDPSDWLSYALLQTTLDTCPDPIFVKDRAHRWVVFNDAFCRLLGRPRGELLGRSDPDLFPPAQVEVFWRLDDALFASGEANENEELLTDADGVVRTIWTRKFPLRSAAGAVIGLCGIIADITQLRRRVRGAERIENELRERAAVLAAQTATLDAIALPIVEVWDGVLLMSLVGELSARRTEQAMHQLLGRISTNRARLVLLDLTGMPVIDAGVAGDLQRTIRAARLLGCDSILCGLGPALATTLVTAGVDLGDVRVCGSVRDALALALRGAPGRGDAR